MLSVDYILIISLLEANPQKGMKLIKLKKKNSLYDKNLICRVVPIKLFSRVGHWMR